MLKSNTIEIEVITPIINYISSKKIHYLDNDAYNVFSSEANNLLYFRTYDTAFAIIHIYQSHADYPLDFIFSSADKNVLHFIHDMFGKIRSFMLDGITVLTDTEKGLERSTEVITNQIHFDINIDMPYVFATVVLVIAFVISSTKLKKPYLN